MWNNFRGLSKNLLHCSKCFTQPARTGAILERKYPVKLNKLTSEVKRRLKRREFYYNEIGNTDHGKSPSLEVVLCRDVPGIGMAGEKIELNAYKAYKDLLLPKLALYADEPRAQEVMKTKVEKQYSSVHSKSVEKYLSTQAVAITLSAETKWKLEQWHVKFALRKIGVLTKDECITIPKEITGPNPDIENKDFLIELTMNKKEKFLLRCRIYHWSSSNPQLNKKVIDVWSPSEPLFPDEKQKIDEIITKDLEIKRKKMMTGGSRK